VKENPSSEGDARIACLQQSKLTDTRYRSTNTIR